MALQALNSNRFALVLCAAASFASCNRTPEAGSTVASLDNFATGSSQSETTNSCGSSYDGSGTLPAHVEALRSYVSAPNDDSRNAVLGVLTVVPKPLMAPFFLNGGKIVISDKAKTICKADSLSPQERALLGGNTAAACWHQPVAGKAPQIVISNDPVVIRHSLLRLFGYVYTEFFADRASQSAQLQADPAWKAALDGFVAVRTGLAAAFVSDLQASGNGVPAHIKAIQNASESRFENFVFAEALDSYYCSSAAKKTFASGFKKTYSVFTGASGNQHAPVKQFGE